MPGVPPAFFLGGTPARYGHVHAPAMCPGWANEVDDDANRDFRDLQQ